jgi:hypothetical protein
LSFSISAKQPVTVKTFAFPQKPIRPFRLLCAALAAAAFLLETGCAVVTVESDPPGARLLYSETGLAPWMPWQPEKGNDITPSRSTVRPGTLRFMRAEKDGYYPSTPQLVEAFLFSPEKITFALAPTPALAAQQKRDAGFVFYEEQWIRPETMNLVEYKGQWMTPEEKISREKTDAGLVLFEGEWVEPDERDRLFAEMQEASGLLLYKGQWVSPDERARQEGIDQIIERAVKLDAEPLPPIDITDRNRVGEPAFVVFNLTRRPLTVFLSGPVSLEIAIGPAEYDLREVPPGQYQLALKPADPEQPMMVGELTVNPADDEGRGDVYSLFYKGNVEPSSDVFALDELYEQIKTESESP